MSPTTHLMNRHEVVGHEVVASYVVYIVDIWQGDRNDPAVEVIRHTGIWRGSDLEDEDGNAIDPDFSKCKPKTYRYSDWEGDGPEPLMWDSLETPKQADREAKGHKEQAIKWEDPEAYVGYSHHTRHRLYIQFLDAIDTLSQDDGDQEAWAAVEAYRQSTALMHER